MESAVIHYMIDYIGAAVLGFALLVAISAPQVWWRDRHKRG
jgi:hypothetical protein